MHNIESRARNATKLTISRYGEDVDPADLCDEVVAMLTPSMPVDMTVEDLIDIVQEAIEDVL